MGASERDTNVSDVNEGGMDHNIQIAGDEVSFHLIPEFVNKLYLLPCILVS